MTAVALVLVNYYELNSIWLAVLDSTSAVIEFPELFPNLNVINKQFYIDFVFFPDMKEVHGFFTHF